MVAGYLLLAILVSWPLAANFTTHITGGGTGEDPTGYVWDFWNHANNGLKLWGTDTQDIIGAPFGRQSPASVNTTLFVTLGPAWVFAKLWSPIVAYNITVFLALTLSASMMYLLVRWLGVRRAPAAWAGAAFMLCPYEMLRAEIHIPLAHIWCFPLIALLALRWIDTPNAKRAIYMSLGLAACWLTMPYYGVMASVLVAVAVTFGLVRTLHRRGMRMTVVHASSAVAALILIVGVPLMLLFSSASGAIDGSLHRLPHELVLYGAHLSDYLLAWENDEFFRGIFGPDRWNDWGSPLGSSTAAVGYERTAFVGYVTLLLATIGIGVTLGQRRRSRRQTLAVLFGLVGIPVFVLFSLASPTSVFGHDVKMPASYLYEVLPYIRVYARFSVVVITLLIVLGALGLNYLIKQRSAVYTVALVSFVFIASALELPPGVPVDRVIASDVPVRIEGRTAQEIPTWRWLANHEPDATVYEFPGFVDEPLARFFMYGQTVHGHRIMNGDVPAASIGADVMVANADPRWTNVAAHLAALDVRLVTISPWAYARFNVPLPNVNRPPKGFEVAKTFADGSAVWRVVAAPSAVVTVPRAGGWSGPQRQFGRTARNIGDVAIASLYARAPGRYRIAFDVVGVRARQGARYRLAIFDADGQQLRQFTVDGRRSVTIDLDLPAGLTDLLLQVTMTAGQRAAPDESGRPVTLSVSEWTATRLGDTPDEKQ